MGVITDKPVLFGIDFIETGASGKSYQAIDQSNHGIA
jgi:hypothetical protein